MIECVSLMCEMLAALILMHSLLGKKLLVKVKEIFLLVVSVVIYYLINIYMLPAYIQVMVYLAVLIYLRVEFSEEKIVKVVGAMLCTAFLVCGIQMPIYYLLEIFQFETYNGRIVNVIILICAIIITKTFNLGKIFSYITKVKFGMAYIILICGLLAVFLLFVLKIIGKFSGLEMFLFDVTFLIVIVCFFQWKTQHDTILMKEREIKWLAQCNDSFEQLITDVRSRQHEFNSQINAICGMQYSCNTYEELVQQINLYTDEIIRENRFNRLLTMECPPIIKGFLYYRFCRANEDSIIIDYEIALDSEMDFSMVFDIVEIVGILFDNACETLKNYRLFQKHFCEYKAYGNGNSSFS